MCENRLSEEKFVKKEVEVKKSRIFEFQVPLFKLISVTPSQHSLPSLSSCSPAGWDNLKKISILYENMHSCKPDDYYTDIIAQPPSRKTVSNREVEVHTEDEQQFLARQQQLLQQGQTAQPRSTSPLRTPTPGTKSGPRTPASAGQGSPNKKVL